MSARAHRQDQNHPNWGRAFHGFANLPACSVARDAAAPRFMFSAIWSLGGVVGRVVITAPSETTLSPSFNPSSTSTTLRSVGPSLTRRISYALGPVDTTT